MKPNEEFVNQQKDDDKLGGDNTVTAKNEVETLKKTRANTKKNPVTSAVVGGGEKTVVPIIVPSSITEELVKGNITEQVLADLKTYKDLKIGGITDKAGYEAVNTARIKCKNVRVMAEKICKDGRAEAIKVQKQWIAKEKEITDQISEVETYLEEQQAVIDQEKEKIKAEKEKAIQVKIQNRTAELLAMNLLFNGEIYSIGEFSCTVTDVRTWDDFTYSRFLTGIQGEVEKEKARLAEEERTKKEVAEKQALVAQQQKEERDRLNAEKKAFEEQQAKAKAEADAKEATLKAEAEKLAAEKIEHERKIKEAETIAAAEKVAAEKALKEAEEKRVADEAAKKKAEEEKIKAEAEAVKKQQEEETKKPDREKIEKFVNGFAIGLEKVTYPEVTTEEGKKLIETIKGQTAKFNEWIRKQKIN
jgi:hypothetical protein